MAQYGYVLGSGRMMTIEALVTALHATLFGGFGSDTKMPVSLVVDDEFVSRCTIVRGSADSSVCDASQRNITFHAAWSHELRVRGAATAFRYRNAEDERIMNLFIDTFEIRLIVSAFEKNVVIEDFVEKGGRGGYDVSRVMETLLPDGTIATVLRYELRSLEVLHQEADEQAA